MAHNLLFVSTLDLNHSVSFNQMTVMSQKNIKFPQILYRVKCSRYLYTVHQSSIPILTTLHSILGQSVRDITSFIMYIVQNEIVVIMNIFALRLPHIL